MIWLLWCFPPASPCIWVHLLYYFYYLWLIKIGWNTRQVLDQSKKVQYFKPHPKSSCIQENTTPRELIVPPFTPRNSIYTPVLQWKQVPGGKFLLPGGKLLLWKSDIRNRHQKYREQLERRYSVMKEGGSVVLQRSVLPPRSGRPWHPAGPPEHTVWGRRTRQDSILPTGHPA